MCRELASENSRARIGVQEKWACTLHTFVFALMGCVERRAQRGWKTMCLGHLKKMMVKHSWNIMGAFAGAVLGHPVEPAFVEHPWKFRSKGWGVWARARIFCSLLWGRRMGIYNGIILFGCIQFGRWHITYMHRHICGCMYVCTAKILNQSWMEYLYFRVVIFPPHLCLTILGLIAVRHIQRPAGRQGGIRSPLQQIAWG